MEQVQEPALDQLRLAQRRGDAQQRLVGEEDRALGHRVDVAGEAQVGERRDEIGLEAAAAREPVELLRREREPGEEIDRLREPRGDQEVAPRRQLAHEALEHRAPVHPLAEVRLQHRQLVQVGQEGTGIHALLAR
jgi:hypothetical protein